MKEFKEIKEELELLQNKIILDTYSVKRLVICINKLDKIESEYNMYKNKVRQLRKTIAELDKETL